MALASEQRQKRSFIFQNSNSLYYRVQLDVGAGTGIGELHGTAPLYGRTPTGLTTTALTFTPAAVADKHDSYLAFSALFNSSQALNAVLNAS